MRLRLSILPSTASSRPSDSIDPFDAVQEPFELDGSHDLNDNGEDKNGWATEPSKTGSGRGGATTTRQPPTTSTITPNFIHRPGMGKESTASTGADEQKQQTFPGNVQAVQQTVRRVPEPSTQPVTTTTASTTTEEATVVEEESLRVTPTGMKLVPNSGFPAILTLEQANGERRRVIVHSADELEWEIQRAKAAEEDEDGRGKGQEGRFEGYF